MDKDLAKQRIQELVEKYEQVLKSGQVKHYSEEETKKDFILPLFEVLGWNVFDKKEVSAEEHIKSAGRVDYGFYLNGRPKFYVEAKAFKADLHNPEFAEQAIRYSWNKGVTWAVLTDFENIKVFNSEAISESLSSKLLFDIPYSEFLGRFDEQLWLLSKDSFEQNLIDKYATKFGKMKQRVPVGEKLYKDLSECREILTKKLSAANPGVKDDLLDEGIQKLLDRLIFIKVAEDRGIEDKTLIPLLRQQKEKETLYESMIEKFRELDDIYNSNLFTPHNFEKWHDDFGATKEVINKLQGVAGYYEYDFKAISADILGAVYENYLGHRLSKSKKGRTLDKDAKKRKEQGIYYTPSFIVDYIVKNALKPVLDRCQSINDLKKIKVLDPACGSGSFLIKALEIINEKYKDFNHKVDEYTKQMILIENLYGVDLDEQAVEITRLNLTLSALETRMKIPLLENIRNGNSLISGTDEELQKYFGKNFRDKKPFNWEEEFPEVFAQGGFDVVIGNPPYGAEISTEDQDYFKKNYDIGSTDTAILLLKKSIMNLKSGGSLGFIIPKAFCFASNYEKIRNVVWDGVNTIIDCGKAWKEVKLEQVIVITKKEITCDEYQSGVTDGNQINIISMIQKKISKQFGFFLNGVSDGEISIAQKILKNSVMLNKISTNQRGAMLQKEISEKGELEVLGGAQISREGIVGLKGKIDKNKIHDDKAFIKPNSVLVQRIVAHVEKPVDHIKITAAIPENKNLIIIDTINQITMTDKKYSPLIVWVILNSNIVNWYAYRFIFGKAIRTMQFDNPTTANIPIPKILEKEEVLEKLSLKLIDLQKELQKGEENSNKWNSIKSEIEKTDKKIDEEVYKLYGLTEEEIKIVEGR